MKPNDPHSSREAVALLRLLTSVSLMLLTIKERATFLTKTTDWERLEDAMRAAENVLGDTLKTLDYDTLRALNDQAERQGERRQ